MLISVFADASYDDATKTGGWGAWVKCARGKKEASGAFKVAVPSNLVAEMLAAANAIWLALKLAETGDHLLVQSDCMAVIDLFNLAKPHGGKQELQRRIKAVVETWCKEAGVTFSFRHVKGHTSGATRHWVNNFCDENARRHMRKARGIKVKQD